MMEFKDGDLVFKLSRVGRADYTGLAEVRLSPSLSVQYPDLVRIMLKEDKPCLSTPSIPYEIGEIMMVRKERVVRLRKVDQCT